MFTVSGHVKKDSFSKVVRGIVILGAGFEDKQGIQDIDPLVFELVRSTFGGLQCGIGEGVCRMGAAGEEG